MSTIQSYSEILKSSPEWRKTRLRILKRDFHSCQLCGARHTELHIHHMYYDAGHEPHEYDDSALITLCKICHQEEENNKVFKNSGLDYAIRIGFLLSDLYFILRAVGNKFNKMNHEEIRKYIDTLKNDLRSEIKPLRK